MSLFNVGIDLKEIPDDIKLLDALVEGALDKLHRDGADLIEQIRSGLDQVLTKHEEKLVGMEIVISLRPKGP